MRKARILLILGVWIVILPYLGFPYSYKDVLTVLSGVALIFVSFLLYKESKAKEGGAQKTFDNFRENNFEESNKEV